MDLSEYVMREGILARAAGRVVVVEGTAWFEPPLARTLVLIHPRPAPRPGRHALRVHGLDVDRLERREEYPGGVIEGWTTLTATWRHSELHTHAQDPTPAAGPRPHRWTTPPCPPPAGGWPVVPLVGAMTAANLPARPPRREDWAELTITQITQFHPQPTQPVLVVAADEPERAEHALRPTFGSALCVVASRYRQPDIDAAQDRLKQELFAHRWRLTSTGRSAGEDGQPRVAAEFAWIESEVAQWAATVPAGLLDADVWLTPATP